MTKWLLYFALKNNHDWDKTFASIVNNERPAAELVEAVYRSFTKTGFKYITILSSNYPQFLKTTKKPPIVVFYKNNIKEINAKNCRNYPKELASIDTFTGGLLDALDALEPLN